MYCSEKSQPPYRYHSTAPITTMSAVLRLNGLLAQTSLTKTIFLFALPALPALPSVSQLIPQWAAPIFNGSSSDLRLKELKELLERKREPPFMFDNGAILRAVPKKKPSYKRTREKRLAPGEKQMKPLENLGRCAACGRVKRSHFMCMHCFGEIRAFLKEKKKQLFGETKPYEPEMDKTDANIVFPKRRLRDLELAYSRKEYVRDRETPLVYNKDEVKKQ